MADDFEKQARELLETHTHRDGFPTGGLRDALAAALRKAASGARDAGAREMRSAAAGLISGWETWDLFREEGAEAIQALPLPSQPREGK